MAEYRWHLARWNERDKTLRCPGCGRGHGCFKEYVDEEGNPVDAANHTVGKCDHETSCGYHITPKEFGADNLPKVAISLPKKDVKGITIEQSLVGKFWRNTLASSNTFIKWVELLPLTDEQRISITKIMQMYAIGTTKDGRIIWWQIDEDRVVRTGKIMQYDADGHRSKDTEGNSIGFGWVHAMLRKQGMFQDTDTMRWDLMQCLFGQHLLPICPDADVHIVESEKTAFLMSIFDNEAMGKNLWLACGGLYNLTPARLECVSKRNVTVYPDSNGVEVWKDKLKGMDVHFATGWMRQLQEHDPKGADIADVCLRRIMAGPEQQLRDMRDKYEALDLLINNLQLELK